MKRFIAMLLILCSALLMTAAFAEEAAPEAKITVVEQRFINMEDDGRGFDVTQALAGEDGRAAWGLLGIQERASLVGGTAELRSTPGQGATVHLFIPHPFREANNDR